MAGFVVNYKIESLRILYPIGMPWIKLMFPLTALESLMIRIEDEFISHK